MRNPGREKERKRARERDTQQDREKDRQKDREIARKRERERERERHGADGATAYGKPNLPRPHGSRRWAAQRPGFREKLFVFVFNRWVINFC